MIRVLHNLLRASRATAAAVLLGALVLGGALHGLHHLQDPGCGDGVDRSGHACTVCSTLHGSTLVAAAVVAPAPQTGVWVPAATAIARTPDARPRRAAVPRAPPAR